jgi:hypothetical protein
MPRYDQYIGIGAIILLNIFTHNLLNLHLRDPALIPLRCTATPKPCTGIMPQ